jgi:exopolysaccharide biosynthesis WecB/TagA/CpsF family protein
MYTENPPPLSGNTPSSSVAVELVDRSLSLTLLLLLSPLMVLRGLVALLRHGRLFDRRAVLGANAQPFDQLQFAGRLPGRSLAQLINLTRGQMRWLGPRLESRNGSGEINPGIFSGEDMRRRIGLVDETESSQQANLPKSPIAYLKQLARSVLVTLFTGARTRPVPQQVTLLGVPVNNHTLDETLDWMFERVAHNEKRFVPFVNAHCLNIASQDEQFRQVLRRADKVLPDGSGVRLACRFHGLNLKDNLNGTDLFPHLCQRAALEGVSLYLLGSAEGVAEQVAQKMVARTPGLKIAGTRNGFFTADEEADVVTAINRSGAGILLVAMGVPQQEMWIDRHLSALQPPINLAVGGLFDFYADRVSRAPMWLREIGMEWGWRLLQEPGRMWRRYILGNPLFILRAWFDFRRHGVLHLITARNTAALRRLSWWLHRHLSARGKRLLDISACATLLLLASPLLLLTALLIRLESPGSVLFCQQRVGLRGKHFNFWKFRSMYIDAEARKASLMALNEMDGGVLFKMKDDPRITRVGKFIRRFSIDELPQLWNVLRGDMSLVGPRPALPAEVALYSVTDRRRLLAPPGITCIWQVSGRSNIPFDGQVLMDMEYIHKSSLGKDVELLLKTVPAVISGRGAY